MDKNVTVGGQAVIEGVMMRGRKGIATAVRTSNGEIIVDKEETIPYTKKYKILGLPIIRGFVSFIDSLIVGIKTLNYSSSFFEDDENESKFDKWFKEKFKDKGNDIIAIVSLIMSLGFTILLFFYFRLLQQIFLKRL